jgi:Immunity protein family (Imm11)
MKNKVSPKYYKMAYDHQRGGASVEYLSDQQYCWDLSIGKKLGDVWPDDMSLKMTPERPKDVKLLDYISSPEDVLLFSPKCRDYFRNQALKEIEFLPVTILDHKGRVASKEYTILNYLRTVDCVDQNESDFTWNNLKEPSMNMEKMVFNPNALGADDRMIRVKFVPGYVFFREDLMRSILQQGFSGVGFSRTLFGDPNVYRAE